MYLMFFYYALWCLFVFIIVAAVMIFMCYCHSIINNNMALKLKLFVRIAEFCMAGVGKKICAC
jgi:hypothetical protein